MARGACDASAQIVAMLAEINRDKKKRDKPFKPDEFNAMRRAARKKKPLNPKASVNKVSGVFGAA